MKKKLLIAIKLGLPVVILAYLLVSVDPADYAAFWRQPKRWDLLILAQVIALLAIIVSILRWRRLVTYFEIPFSTSEALRLGFLGYLLNFIALGSVGGDFFKAILVAKQKPSKKPEAIASVLLDRALGLLGLILLAWMAIFFFADESLPRIFVGIGHTAGGLSAVSIVSLLVAVYAGKWLDPWIDWAEQRLPWIGPVLARMARAVRLLKKTPSAIPVLMLSSIVVHGMLTYCVCMISWGIYPDCPSLKQHFLVVPVGMAAGAVPLTPGGVGIQEGAIVGLFKRLPSLPETYSPVLVATIYRLITLAIAGVGLAYYVASHGRQWQELRKARAEAEI